MSETSAEEAALKLELLKMDVQLRGKQLFWETPRGILLVLATGAAIGGALVSGFLSRSAPAPIVIQLQQPPAAALKP